MRTYWLLFVIFTYGEDLCMCILNVCDIQSVNQNWHVMITC